uniref:PSP domain-containing protein n=1 Tax=Heterorhabditis bacteriophora TaxID=37862 RepID=A0A1I7X6X0_HETBA
MLKMANVLNLHLLRKGKRSTPPVVVNSDVMKGNEADYGDFVLDRTESLDHSSDVSVISTGYIEATSSKWLKRTYSNLLNVNEADENGNSRAKESSKQSRLSCFNCDGQHNMNVCPEPKNMKRIRERKIELREKRQRLDNLRHALGIGPDDIPEWIYRMRKMGFIEGYPPGYLKKAIKREDSVGILTFHTVDGSEGSNNDDATNSEYRSDSPPPVIDSDKIIYYLGFNQMYKNLRDLENFKVPPFQEFVAYHQEVLIKKYNERQAGKMRLRDKNRKLLKQRQEEMEMDGDIMILEPLKPPILNEDDSDIVIINSETAKVRFMLFLLALLVFLYVLFNRNVQIPRF